MAATQEKLTIDFRIRNVSTFLWVAYFQDHSQYVAFVPSLNLTAYGQSKEEARKMLFEDIVTDYFDNLLQMKEADVIKELSKHGWRRNKIVKKRFTNTPPTDSKGILKNFNLPLETEISHNMIGEQISTAA